jgi:hypothetical protein
MIPLQARVAVHKKKQHKACSTSQADDYTSLDMRQACSEGEVTDLKWTTLHRQRGFVDQQGFDGTEAKLNHVHKNGARTGFRFRIRDVHSKTVIVHKPGITSFSQIVSLFWFLEDECWGVPCG